MCGIVGILEGKRLRADRSVIAAMLSRIRHRGPDAEGIWSEANVWLGHRRLSIIDVSSAAAQPMLSHCRRYVISFNGEIYNYQELRAEIQRDGAIAWRSLSDTEVLLELIARRGFRTALQAINGMFALAVWDRKERALFLARDRFGEKPLYYGMLDDGVVFASELTAIEACPSFPKEIDGTALASFLKYGNVPQPLSIYQGVSKLPPGAFRAFTPRGSNGVEAYWSITEVARQGLADPIHDKQEMLERLETALTQSCRQKMVSDVPLGAFLSGGIDSSTVVALMQKQSPRPIKTFTIGFDIPAYSEANHAKAVAQHLGTDHSEQILTERDALDVAPQLGAIYDEPFADSSAIPTYLVSRMARSQVTVALSGDGGDEMFAGYPRYVALPYLWRRLEKIPARCLIAKAIEKAPFFLILALIYPIRGIVGRQFNITSDDVIRKLQKLRNISIENFQSFYDGTLSFCPNPGELLLNPPSAAVEETDKHSDIFGNQTDWMCWYDSIKYLPDDILTKVDRASMAVSLEGRMPMLDPNVAEIAWRLPGEVKMRDGNGKWPLRQILYKHVPRELFDRPKMGFGIPMREWLLGPLRAWAHDLLSPERVAKQGLLNVEATSACLDDFMTRRRPEQVKLWTLLMLQSWLDKRGR
jgi:asparagine synthase (glutamine-hydrolysing)